MTEHNENNDVKPETGTEEENTTENTANEAEAPAIEENEKLAAAVAEAADLKDRLLRSVAEMENLRRRTDREKADAANYAMTAFARDLLSVGDNLRRALESIPEDTDLGENARTLVEGIQMTERELNNMLERHNIRKVEPMGEKFNHNLHQAMFEVPGSGKEDGTVIQVMQVGYVIKDRLLRPAMVGVAKDGDKPPKERVDTKV